MRKLIFILVLTASNSAFSGAGSAPAALLGKGGANYGAGDMGMTGVEVGGETAGANAGASKVFGGECSAESWGSCVLMALSAAQGVISIYSAVADKNSQSGFSNGSGANGFDGPSWEDIGKANFPNETATFQQAFKDLNAKGFKVDMKDKSITLPNNKKIPMSAITSAKSLVDLGISTPEQAAALDAKMKKIADSFKVGSIGVAGGGGGGSAAKPASYSYDDPFKSLFGQKANGPRTAGLTRSIASGETIGAQTDNIFEMVKRRYQQKSGEKIFVGQEPAQAGF